MTQLSMSESTTMCAFDIGIKNLSYCVITKTGDSLHIDDWDLIDLQPQHDMVCIAEMKNGRKCGRPGVVQHPTDISIIYCQKHLKCYNFSVPNINILDKHNTSAAECNHKSEPCHSKCTRMFLDNYYCLVHAKQAKMKYVNANKLHKIHTTQCMKEPLYILGTQMFNVLENKPHILQADKIVIENQPSLTNPTMKSISVMLMSFFIVRKHKSVEFVAPSGKLKINEPLTKTILSKYTTKSNKYAVTKELGIKYTTELLFRFDNALHMSEKLCAVKKKDDMCDAFLHAYYHLCGKTGLETKEFTQKTEEYFAQKSVKQNKNQDKIICLDI